MRDATGAAPGTDEELARTALLELTTADTIGALESTVDEGQGTVTLYFAATKAGYPGWRWTVSLAHVEGSAPTVLETELTPGDGALLSPDWVPWADRLADYQAAQETERAAAAEAGELLDEDDDSDDADADGDFDDEDDDDDDDDEDDDEDDDGFDDDEHDERQLHGGDVDGVDIDSLHDDEHDEEE